MSFPNPDQTSPTRVEGDPAAGETVPTLLPPADAGEAAGAPTVAVPVSRASIPAAPQPARPALHRWQTWLGLGLLALLVGALLSGFAGYQSGLQLRKDAASGQIIAQLDEQFRLAGQDMQDGRYDIAQQRLNYILAADPGYPGAVEALTQVELRLNATATPTPAPTATPTPAPTASDGRVEQQMLDEARQLVLNSSWTAAIDKLLALRKANPAYEPVAVDGLLYISYRVRGRDKILKEADLEGGIYDLTLAQRMGPLDAEARGLLTWSRLYITGASFWEIDWAQAVYYFGQVAPVAPNLRDSSGWTATERYILALVGYGDMLAETKSWCDAVPQYEAALALSSDPAIVDKYNTALSKCSGDDGDEDKGNDDGGGEPAPTEPPPPEPTPGPTPYP
jgi:hypothetical protein